ncbi:MAG: hypothetical protein E7328_02635 [Clostridiales bacterium]|nr:hypothetical protein [Clostridiales bacterium]
MELATYQALWEYQKADLDLNRFERQLKNSETRKKLLSVRNYLLDQQKKVKQLEEDLEKGQQNAAAVSGDIQKVLKDFALLEDQLDNIGEDDDIGEVRRISKEMDRLSKRLGTLNKELETISRLAYGADGVLKDAYVKMQKAKVDFDTLKAKHDEELAASQDEYNALKAVVAEREKAVNNAELMAEYKKIRKNRVNPLARVTEDRCSGCNMTIPSLTLRKIKEGDGIFECESCGRILYSE